MDKFVGGGGGSKGGAGESDSSHAAAASAGNPGVADFAVFSRKSFSPTS